MTKYCMNCGTEVDDKATVCYWCGEDPDDKPEYTEYEI